MRAKLGLSSLLASLLITTELHAQSHDYQAVVVGTGYGGSVAALNLGRAGINTLVLERGRWWKVSDPSRDATFATLESLLEQGDSRGDWLADECTGNLYTSFLGPLPCTKTTGVMEYIDAEVNPYDHSPALRTQGIEVMVGAGVGGGSLINNGIAYPPTKLAWDAAFPVRELPHMQEIWRELSSRYFALAQKGLAPEPPPRDVLASDAYAGTRMLDALFAQAGYPSESGKASTALTGRTFAPVIVHWNRVRDELAGRRVPAASLGEAWAGINSGAKRSLDQKDGYLGRALATGSVEVRALHTVTDIHYDRASRRYVVEVVRTNEAYDVLERLEFKTPHLILSAGAVGTTKLLVRARDSGALPALSSAVGTYFSSNGTQAHLRLISDAFVPQGGPAGIRVSDFSEPGNPLTIENLPQRVPNFFADDPTLAPFFGAIMTISIGVPKLKGTFRYEADTDTVVLDWPNGAAQNVYDRTVALLTQPRLGGTPVILPEEQAMRTSLHPLGGVPLGVATDSHCQLRGYKGLYAVDGSLVPGPSAAANPSFLITALAERCMEKIVRAIR